MRRSRKKLRIKSEKLKRNILIFLIILILIVFGLLIGSRKIEWKRGVKKENKSLTKTVKTEKVCAGKKYINWQNGYEICYPQDWFYKEFGGEKETAGFDERPIPSATEYLGKIVISVKSGDLTTNKKEIEKRLGKAEEEDFTMDGIKGKSIMGTTLGEWDFFSGEKERIIIWEKEGKTWEISLKKNEEIYLKIFEQIVGSFRFLPIKTGTVYSTTGTIRITAPLPLTYISNPLKVEGKVEKITKSIEIILTDTEGASLGRVTIDPNNLTEGKFKEYINYFSPVPPAKGVLKVYVDKEETAEVEVKFR